MAGEYPMSPGLFGLLLKVAARQGPLSSLSKGERARLRERAAKANKGKVVNATLNPGGFLPVHVPAADVRPDQRRAALTRVLAALKAHPYRAAGGAAALAGGGYVGARYLRKEKADHPVAPPKK